MITIPVILGTEHAKMPVKEYKLKVIEVTDNPTPDLLELVKASVKAFPDFNFAYRELSIIYTKRTDDSGITPYPFHECSPAQCAVFARAKRIGLWGIRFFQEINASCFDCETSRLGTTACHVPP